MRTSAARTLSPVLALVAALALVAVAILAGALTSAGHDSAGAVLEQEPPGRRVLEPQERPGRRLVELRGRPLTPSAPPPLTRTGQTRGVMWPERYAMWSDAPTIGGCSVAWCPLTP